MKTLLGALAAFSVLLAAQASADPVKPVIKAPLAMKTAPLQPEIARKIDLLKGAGIVALPEAVKTPVTLTVRAPVKDSYTHLSFRGVASYDPAAGQMTLLGSQAHEATSGSGGSFGVGIIPAIPEINTSAVTISFRAAAGFRYILDCKVSGAEEYRFAEFTGDGSTWRSTRVRPVDGRVTLLMLAPREGPGKKAFLTGFTNQWSWESCEITPVG